MQKLFKAFTICIWPRLWLGLLITIMILGLCATGNSVQAQSLIRDREIERIFGQWFAPIVEAAELAPNSVNIILIQDNQINAFVAGGPNVFFFTGLLLETKTPEEIIGVFAHEVGHIRGGHLIRGRQALEKASYETLIGTILGLGAAIASGNGGAAGTISAGAQDQAFRRFLSHSRVQESSADQAALNYITKAKMSPIGLISFFRTLQSKHGGTNSRRIEYTRTHPLTGNRINDLMREAETSPYLDKRLPEQWYKDYDLIKAKLLGFIKPGHVEWTFGPEDKSIPAEYARAIAAYRRTQYQKSIEILDRLIKRAPNNPYFHELKGQVLVDAGRITDALAPYRKAVQLDPEAGLIRIALAHALIESGLSHHKDTPDTNKQIYLREAINHLKNALGSEKRSARLHRLLATSYGRLGQTSLARLHLAEEAVLRRKWGNALDHARVAAATLEKESREHLQALDLIQFIENHKNQ